MVEAVQKQHIRQNKIQEKKEQRTGGGDKGQVGGVSKWKLASMQFRMALEAGRAASGGGAFQATSQPTFSGLQPKPDPRQSRGGKAGSR